MFGRYKYKKHCKYGRFKSGKRKGHCRPKKLKKHRKKRYAKRKHYKKKRGHKRKYKKGRTAHSRKRRRRMRGGNVRFCRKLLRKMKKGGENTKGFYKNCIRGGKVSRAKKAALRRTVSDAEVFKLMDQVY